MTDRPEHDPAVRDRVLRLVGVLERAARARTRPVRHTRGHPGALPLVDVTDQLAIRRPRAAGDGILRVTRSVPHQRATFDALFDLHRLAADAPETVELVLAGGLLHHADPEVHAHLITREVTVERDAEHDAMVVMLAGEAVTVADDELLDGLDLTDTVAAGHARAELHSALVSPLDPGLTDVLRGWAHRCLRVPHEVGDDWIAPVGPVTRLVPAPTLVARRRPTTALRTVYDRIRAELADPARGVPVGLAQLVTAIEPADRVAWLARAGHDAAPLTDPLFALPVGPAQARILSRLGRDSGVVVEGPPGTGKTHTIANLMGALLAEGRRVLVTSEKAQALRVLAEMLPPEMRALCVAADGIDEAGPDGSSATGAAASIAGLAARSTEFDADAADEEIVALTARRHALLTEREARLDAVVAVRNRESVDAGVVAPGFAGTRSAVARRVLDTRARDGWLATMVFRRDADPLELPPGPPLTGAEMAELAALLASETPQRRRRPEHHLPPPVELPPEHHVAELMAVLRRGDALVAGPDGHVVVALGRLPDETAHRLPVECRRVADATVALFGGILGGTAAHGTDESADADTSSDGSWVRGAIDAVLSGRASSLWRRAVARLDRVDALAEHDQKAGVVQVQVAASVDPSAAAEAFERFAAHRADGGTVRALFKAGPQRDAEAFLADVTVRGADPSTASGASAVAHHLRVLEITDELADGFGPLGCVIVRRSEHRSALVEAAFALRETCLRIGAVLAAVGALQRLLAGLPPAHRLRLDDLAGVDAVLRAAESVPRLREADLARAELADLVTRLGGGEPERRWAPEIVDVVAALRAPDADAYAAAAAATEMAVSEQRDQRRADVLAARLDASAPGLTDRLRACLATTTASSGPAGESAPAAVVRSDRWAGAWAHARAECWLRAPHGFDTADTADAALDAVDDELRRVTVRLATARAWRACLTRITAEQMRALQSHRGVDAAVGRGTGRWADRYRDAAREAVLLARDAVPARVMPIREVLAGVDPVRDAFDVVIVDEASQADLTSLFLLWLAPRVIVVGDDRQCTPVGVGVGGTEPAFARLDAELPDVPPWLRSQFSPRSSVFSVFRATFGPPIRLREHFRSMPEIIAWSSREFYARPDDASPTGGRPGSTSDGPLVPLRRYSTDRLPPLRATLVPGAEVRGSGSGLTNPAEAEALVAAVVRAAKDPAYDAATFGVVVLQGHSQVDLITSMLRGRLDADQWPSRRLRVGVPADFQGDERTVVWLSMVVAPGHRLVALTADRYRQAFNVAASRARDQLWLVHSVSTDDLAPGDLRRRLLEHVTDPDPSPEPHLDRLHAGRAGWTLADGSFPERVGEALAARGYTVDGPMTLLGLRVDLMVTGVGGRAVVVCDGERTRTVDRAHVAGERDLGRCGWPVLRVAESDGVLDPDAMLAGLLDALEAAGVRPPDSTPVPMTVIERAPEGGIDYEPSRLGGRADTVDTVVDDLVGAGYASPRRAAEVTDPRDGSTLVVAAALWPTGISLRALAAPVVLTTDADPYAVSRLRGLGYEVFTSVDEIREHAIGSGDRP